LPVERPRMGFRGLPVTGLTIVQFSGPAFHRTVTWRADDDASSRRQLPEAEEAAPGA